MFQRLSRASRGVVEIIHGDAVTIHPIARGNDVNSKGVIVPGTAYETVACFFENTLVENDAKSQPLTGEGRMIHAAPGISASVRLIADKPFSADCIIERPANGLLYRVVSFKPDGLGTVLAILSVTTRLPGTA